eukprot:TRINITY_DN41118_c0_g1_i1.p1 TRINITY_DN41118_c0_g1~~TRINITY_DN41118_c0_g1_i1.p1  ORF type:complete len:572 (+),score=121.82 TRINITY_DN41118_c0_g1_i1:46-1761(+)
MTGKKPRRALAALLMAATVTQAGCTEVRPSPNTYVPPAKTKITSLPGVSGKLPNEMYAGYIEAGTPPSGKGKMYFHYWCIMSARNASVDPVLFWYNGGPGASSLFGLLQEFGPLLLNEDSLLSDDYKKTGIPTPQENEWAWTRTNTVCALDSPPPMGLSFCSEEGPSGRPTSCGPWTDTAVFAANHKAHASFYENIFPELKSNPMYFIGESYAGIYVPGFANAMMDDPVPGLNFKGFGVGDGWPGCVQIPGRPVNWCINLDNVGLFEYPNALPGPYWDIEFFHGRNQMSTELYNNIVSTCTKNELRGVTMPMSERCNVLIKQIPEEVGVFDAYNVLNACPADGDATTVLSKHGANRAAQARAAEHHMAAMQRKAAISPGDGDGGVGSPCLGDSINTWLMHPDTLKAIGSPADSKFINLDNGHGFNYTTNRHFVGDVYEKALKKGLRVLVYEGDQDACGLGTLPIEEIFVPLFDGLAKRTQRWTPWAVEAGTKILGGYAYEWDGGRVRFASVRGAGHMGPLNRPHAAFTLVNALTNEDSLPPINKGVTQRVEEQVREPVVMSHEQLVFPTVV